METLRCFARYNGWANDRVFALCRALEPAQLGDAATGTIGTVESTLKHLVGVEDAYLAMLRGQDPMATIGSREAYMQRDFAWFAGRSAALAGEYQSLLADRDQAFLESELRIPWLTAPVTARDGLLQVFTHSTQHRAQVLSVLGERGEAVPDVDYAFMLAEAQQPADV